jgi:hypothetical protein
MKITEAFLDELNTESAKTKILDFRKYGIDAWTELVQKE